MERKITVICLVPTRNNAALIERCLKSASLWADVIIVCDQLSTDGTREIAQRFEKVRLIDNPTEEYNESFRQKLLINEARKIQGNRLLITLDVDEIFSPDILHSAEWETVINSKPGTMIFIRWANLCPDLENMWYGPHLAFGYKDDDSPQHSDNLLHSPRIPNPVNHNILYLNDIKVIHFQYVDWNKMQSKQRYYQCIELITYPEKSPVDIFRSYNHMYKISNDQKIKIPHEWIIEYNKLGIDITSLLYEPENWYEKQLLMLIEEKGASYFRKLRIWDVNWIQKAQFYSTGQKDFSNLKDPRSKTDKRIQKWLMMTQEKSDKRRFKIFDRMIKYIFKY